MARNVKWRMQFMAFDNVTQYTVSIYTEDAVSSVVDLIPSANPFETQENNDNNAFIPVRPSTGYLRFVVTDLSIIDEIMCTKVDGRYVTLTKQVNGQTVIVWHGYLQTESFNCDWTATPYEIEFPIVSALGVLENMTYTPLNDYLPIGYIIRRALDNNYMDFTRFFTPYRGETHDFLAYLNDISFNKDEHDAWKQYLGYNPNTLFPSEERNCLSVISDICQFFGWSLYERGTDLYFVSVNGTDTYQYGLFSNVTQAGGITIDGIATTSAQTLPTVRSADNNREFLKGYGYFEISESLKTPTNPVNFNINEVAPPSGSYIRNGNPLCFYIPYGNVESGDIKAQEDKTGDLLGSASAYYGCQLALVATYDSNTWNSVQENRDNFKPTLAIKKGPQEKVAIFESVRNVSFRTFSRGCILKMNVKYWNYNESKWDTIPENMILKFGIQWGDRYLSYSNRSYSWVINATSFNLNAESSIEFFFPTYSEFQGWNYNGVIKVYIYALTSTDGNISKDTILLQDISLEAAYPNQSPLNSETDFTINRFRMTSSMGGSEVFTQENALCSALNVNQESDAMLMNSDKTALATQPEIDTVTRMKNMYGQPAEQVNVFVDGVDFTPYNPITYNSKQYFCASIATNWRDRKTKMQLQMLPV